jgi:hypothetical protein
MRFVVKPDRREVPGTAHEALRAVISEGWQLDADDRPSFEGIWGKLRDAEFRVFRGVVVEYRPAQKDVRA